MSCTVYSILQYLKWSYYTSFSSAGHTIRIPICVAERTCVQISITDIFQLHLSGIFVFEAPCEGSIENIIINKHSENVVICRSSFSYAANNFPSVTFFFDVLISYLFSVLCLFFVCICRTLKQKPPTFHYLSEVANVYLFERFMIHQ